MQESVLVAGATGELGRHVVRALKARGCRVRALVRSAERGKMLAGLADELHIGDATKPETLANACQGIDVLFSALGESVQLGRAGRPFREVDLQGNLNLLEAARKAGVRRIVYVSVFGTERYAQLEYARVHDLVASAIVQSGLEYAIILPTGFFSSLGPLVAMLRGGWGSVIGDGTARSNPIHDLDLAEVCADAVLEAGSRRQIPVGGPTIHTRREMMEAAIRVSGKRPKLASIPGWIPRLMARILRPFSPRQADLIAFYAAIGELDLVAPSYGQRRLEDYFREVAAGSSR